MGKSIEDQLPKYRQMTFEDSRSAIFLPESEDGHSLSGSQDGAPIVPSGRDLVPVSHSAKPVNKKPRKTNDISGQKCSGSSASASLSQCLANRLRQQLAMHVGNWALIVSKHQLQTEAKAHSKHLAPVFVIAEAENRSNT